MIKQMNMCKEVFMRKTVIMIRIYMLCMQQCACAAKEEKKRIRRMHSGRRKKEKGTHATLPPLLDVTPPSECKQILA